MPPQPLSRVCRGANTYFSNPDDRVLAKRPELAVLAIEAISSWSNVESFLLALYVQLFGGTSDLAARVYLALKSNAPKIAALSEAINSVEDEDLQRLIKAIVEISRANEKDRDKLAHQVWGISPEIPDGLLLTNPKNLLPGSLDLNEIFVYKAGDFQKIIDANDRLCRYGLELMFILNNHPSNRDGQLYAGLCSQPEVKERLERRAQQDRCNTQESS